MPSPRPLLSVIIATYKRARSVGQCVRSVLSEPGDDFEVVIGDDASPDDTPAVIEPFLADPRVRHYRNPVNLGMQGNYLKIAREAAGEYLFILTDDDTLEPGALDRVRQVIRRFPEVTYITSDLATYDARNGQLFGLHRTFPDERLVPPTLENLTHLAGSAWVLSRQTLKKAAIDWNTWERFGQSIYFPIINAGRLALNAPAYYLTGSLVRHTFFNEVHWHRFGANEVEIALNLHADHGRCLREILHDQPLTPEAQRLIARWEAHAFRNYLYAYPNGYLGLIRQVGWRNAQARLESAFPIGPEQRRELRWFPLRIARTAAWAEVKHVIRRYAPGFTQKVKQLRAAWRI